MAHSRGEVTRRDGGVAIGEGDEHAEELIDALNGGDMVSEQNITDLIEVLRRRELITGECAVVKKAK